MTRHLFLSVLFGTLLLLAIALFIPGQRDSGSIATLPWHISITADGQSTVFGVTLEQTTLGEVEQIFGSQAAVSLFAPREGEYRVEAFFDQVTLNGLKARFVFVVGVRPDQLAGSFERGVRIATLGSGIHKVTLSSPDLALVRSTPVTALTYLPRTDLAPELVARRFGKPAERISEREGIEHWLYPEKGLDVALYGDDTEVLHYVAPARFEMLRQPLRSLEATAFR